MLQGAYLTLRALRLQCQHSLPFVHIRMMCVQLSLLISAFTPLGAPQTHLPGFVASLDKFKAAGAEVIVFTAVNDPFVLTEWGVQHAAFGKASVLLLVPESPCQAFPLISPIRLIKIMAS